MQNLRRGYIKLQQKSFENYQKLTEDQFQALLKVCNKQYQAVISSDDYTNLEELMFYRQRLQKIIDAYEGSTSKKTLKNNVKAILGEIYPQNQEANRLNEEDRNVQPNIQKTASYTLGKEEKKQHTPKEVITSFFMKKKEEVEKTKKGFDSILKDLPKPSRKLQVKSSKIFNDQQQLKQLKKELQRLKQQQQRQRTQANKQQNILKADKKQLQKKIMNLVNKIQDLKRENIELKDLSDTQKDPKIHKKPTPFNGHPKPYIYRDNQQEQNINHQQHMFFKQNDTGAIKKKTNPLKDKHKLGTHQRQQIKELENNPRALTQQYIPIELLNVFDLQRNKSYQMGKTSNLRFNRSQLEDSAKNIAIRSKISYFKPSMILYRSDIFEVAVKSSSIKPLCQKKVKIYINNRSVEQLKTKITYKYDKNYFNLTSIKKIQSVYPKQQQRQQVNIILLTEKDFDSAIEVELTIDSKTLNFLLPANFLQFVDKRPKEKQKIENKYESIRPIHQFSTFQLASEILPLQRVQNELFQTGRLFAISKHHEGYIYLRWMNKRLQIETIPQWRLFISYLLLKDY